MQTSDSVLIGIFEGKEERAGTRRKKGRRGRKKMGLGAENGEET